ncbi:hypothetical protein D3C81_2064380 [compost metagenome]
MLVIFDQYVFDARTQLAGDPGDFTLDVRIVGAFVEAPLEVPLGKEGEGNQGYQANENQQATFQLGRHGQVFFKKCKGI